MYKTKCCGYFYLIQKQKDMDHSIQLLHPLEIDKASITLSNAFLNDPLQRYTFPDEQERKEKSPLHFKSILQFGLQFGAVYRTAGELGGVAVWLKPGETEVTAEKAEAGGLTRLPELVGEEPMSRFFAALDYIEPYHKLDMPEPHWYIMVIGVDPAFQGKGLGRALLQPILDKADVTNTPCYLETAQPANVSFYNKLGFRIVRELIDPVSGLTIWTFRRNTLTQA